MRSKRVLCAAVLVGAGIAAFASQPGVAAPGGRRLFVTGFAQISRSDVVRNEVLEFRFSGPVRRGSVNDRTLQVNEVLAPGERPAVGARIVAGNIVRFDPRRTQRNYDGARLEDSVDVEPDHVYGFSANATYVVRIRNGADVTTVRGSGGAPLANSLTTSFTTGDRYDDPVPGQPSFIGENGSGLFGFDPPRVMWLVYDYASMIFEFDEPILPSSMRLGETVIVTRWGKPLAGALAPDAQHPNGRRFTFTPTNGWSGGTAGPPYLVVAATEIRVTTGVTDLAGNPLKRAIWYH
jgi:hypothetical protein